MCGIKKRVLFVVETEQKGELYDNEWFLTHIERSVSFFLSSFHYTCFEKCSLLRSLSLLYRILLLGLLPCCLRKMKKKLLLYYIGKEESSLLLLLLHTKYKNVLNKAVSMCVCASVSGGMRELRRKCTKRKFFRHLNEIYNISQKIYWTLL
jgi:hypothetical protein